MFEKFLKITEANKEIDSLNEKVEALEEANAEATDYILKLKNEANAAKEIADERSLDCEKANARIAQLESDFISADEKALEIVSEMGLKSPLRETEASEVKSVEELWTEYHQIQNSKEKNQFYKDNREQFLKG